jgi:hypothetical protein
VSFLDDFVFRFVALKSAPAFFETFMVMNDKRGQTPWRTDIEFEQHKQPQPTVCSPSLPQLRLLLKYIVHLSEGKVRGKG